MIANHRKTIFKILKHENVKLVVEIGLKSSMNYLLPFFAKKKAKYIGIDPVRNVKLNFFNFLLYKKYYKWVKGYSLDVLPLLKDIDVLFIDGDHTYYTVLNELRVAKKAVRKGGHIFLHDVEPPWDRKDLYYNIDLIPEEFRNGDKQGVLTAIEDFLLENPGWFSNLKIFSGFNGLGYVRKVR